MLTNQEQKTELPSKKANIIILVSLTIKEIHY